MGEGVGDDGEVCEKMSDEVKASMAGMLMSDVRMGPGVLECFLAALSQAQREEFVAFGIATGLRIIREWGERPECGRRDGRGERYARQA